MTPGVAIRDAAFARLSALPGLVRKRKLPLPQLQPSDLPALSVFLMEERYSEHGDGNHGEPAFYVESVIGVSIERGFDDPADLAALTDADAEAVLNTLLTDPTFVTFGPTSLFEAVTDISCRRSYPSNGETYWGEVRFEITFRSVADFPPVVPDDYAGGDVTERPFGAPAATPAVRFRFNDTP